MPSVRTPEQIAARTFITRRDTIMRKLLEFIELTGSEMAVLGRHNGESYSFGTEELLDSLGMQVNTRLSDPPGKPMPKPGRRVTSSQGLISTMSELPESPVGSTSDFPPPIKSLTQTPHSGTPSTPRRGSSHSPRTSLAHRTRRRGGPASPLWQVSRRTVSPTPLKRLSQYERRSLESLMSLD